MLELSSVSKRFPNGYQALLDIGLSVQEGEIVGLVGTSGCGKSTLLRVIGGLEAPSAGNVSVDGHAVEAGSHDIAHVFQEARLLPWKTVSQNIELALHDRPKKERRVIVERVLDRIGLGHAGDLLPGQISGGMAQRVSIARALVREPRVLLLDEPFSALDSFTRLALQDHLLDLWAEQRFTAVFVTHDLEEALALCDRIVVMKGNPGRIETIVPVTQPRPRDRTGHRFQQQKAELLDILTISPEERPTVAGAA